MQVPATPIRVTTRVTTRVTGHAQVCYKLLHLIVSKCLTATSGVIHYIYVVGQSCATLNQGLNMINSTSKRRAQLHEYLFSMQEALKQAKEFGDWDQVDYIGECIDATEEELAKIKAKA